MFKVVYGKIAFPILLAIISTRISPSLLACLMGRRFSAAACFLSWVSHFLNFCANLQFFLMHFCLHFFFDYLLWVNPISAGRPTSCCHFSTSLSCFSYILLNYSTPLSSEWFHFSLHLI